MSIDFCSPRERPAIAEVVAGAAIHPARRPGILPSGRALCQFRRNGASGQHRGHRRGRSQTQLHLLIVASRRAPMKSSAGESVSLQARPVQNTSPSSKCLVSEFCGSLSLNHRGPELRQMNPLTRAIRPDECQRSGNKIPAWGRIATRRSRHFVPLVFERRLRVPPLNLAIRVDVLSPPVPSIDNSP